jgi:hypothetical protein
MKKYLILAAVAIVAVVADAVKFGYDAKITHGNTTVQIGDGVKED